MGDKSSLFNRLSKPLFWMTSNVGGQSILQLIVLAVLSRLLSPEDFGLMAATLIIINFADIFSQLGMGSAIIQKKNITDNEINTAFSITLFFSLLVSIIIFLSSGFIAEFMNMPKLEILIEAVSIIFMFKGVSSIHISMLEKQMKFKIVAHIDLLTYTIGFLGVGITMAILGMGIWALVCANLTQAFLRAVISYAFNKQKVKIKFRFSKESLNNLVSSGTSFTISKILGYFANNADFILVGSLLGATALGLYNRAYQLMSLASNTIGTVIDRVFFPSISQIQTEKNNLKNMYLKSHLFLAFIIFPATILSWVFAPHLVDIILGSGWEEVVLPFRLLAVGMFFKTCHRLSNAFIKGLGRNSQRIYVQLIYLIMIIAGTYIGHFHGIEGVSFFVLISIVINFIIITSVSKSLISISWYEIIKLFKYPIRFSSLIAIVLVVSTSVTNKLFSVSSIIFIIVNIILCCLILLVILKFFFEKIFGFQFINIKNNLIRKVKGLL